MIRDTGFPKRSCSNKKIERDDDSKKSHRALAGAVDGIHDPSPERGNSPGLRPRPSADWRPRRPEVPRMAGRPRPRAANPNLTVQLFRPPLGEWVGIRAQTRWQPATGVGIGSGMLLDVRGEIGRVSMSVVLVPFPKPAAAAN